MSSFNNNEGSSRLQCSHNNLHIPTCKFSRSGYFNRILNSSETVRLVILSTYRLDIRELSNNFPHVFDFDSKKVIPTIVLHGDKDSYVCKISHDAERQQLTKSISRKIIPPVARAGNNYDSEDEYNRRRPEASTWSRARKQHVMAHVDLTHICEVLPQWTSQPSGNDANRSGTTGSSISRNAIMGVHHPKYMLIFTSLGVHVSISTANISSQQSTDMTWTQFFPLRRDDANKTNNGGTNEIGSDFGEVLQDFIQKQSEQIVQRGDGDDTAPQPPDVMRFIHLHTGMREGDTLASTYDFSQAQVDLISVVPGRDALSPLSTEGVRWLYQHCGRDPDLVSAVPCKACTARRRKLRTVNVTTPGESAADSVMSDTRYGMLRVRDLLVRNEHLLSRSLTAQDILVVQPTSIGVRIDNYYVDALLCHYMPESQWEEQYDALRQDSWRLVWPSADFISKLSRQSGDGDDDDDEEEGEGAGSGGDEGCGLFLHPRSFAAMEFDIHAQFHTYEASSAAAVRDLSSRFPPHNKSYARVMARNTEVCEVSKIIPLESAASESIVGIPTTVVSTELEHNLCPQEVIVCPFDFPLTQLTPPSLSLLLEGQSRCSSSSCSSSDGTSSTEFDECLRELDSLGDVEEEEEEESVCGEHNNVCNESKHQEQEECSCADLAWCVLTSACLSRGAQGDDVSYGVCNDCGNIQTGYVEFRNFELGVMFHSRPGMKYRALSGRCALHGQQQQQQQQQQQTESHPSSDVILLPLPYEVLGGDAYCSEGGAFRHRPFFHENHEANKYTVNQTLPQAVVASKKAVATSKSSVLKRSLTLDDGAMRHTELWASKRSMFACSGEGEMTLVPRSLQQQTTRSDFYDPPATRAKTVGCSLTSVRHDWSQQSDESIDDEEFNERVKHRTMNITDFLC